MQKTYDYFAASLPMLQFDTPSPFSLSEFLRNAQALLDSADYEFIVKLLERKDVQIETTNTTHQSIYQTNQNYHNALAAFRAQRAGKDAAEHVRGYPFSNEFLNTLIHQAAKDVDLLKGEKLLDKAKWTMLEDMAAGHFTDIVFISAYALQLQILDRYNEINSSKGPELLEEYMRECMPQKI